MNTQLKELWHFMEEKDLRVFWQKSSLIWRRRFLISDDSSVSFLQEPQENIQMTVKEEDTVMTIEGDSTQQEAFSQDESQSMTRNSYNCQFLKSDFTE